MSQERCDLEAVFEASGDNGGTLGFNLIMSTTLPAVERPGLVAFWDFQESAGQARVSRGPHAYRLRESAGSVARVEGGVFGPFAADLKRGDYFFIPRAECPALNICGPGAQVSVVAWLQRHRKREVQCEAVAGMWHETSKRRQYGLFLDLRIHQAGDNVAGHVSATGGPTPGYPWCMDAAIGAGYLTYFDWHCAAFTYNGHFIRAWLDGRLETRVGFNPFAYPHGIFDGGPDGADFTVGGVHRSGEMGNWFVGHLGGLAVYSRGLEADEIAALAALLPVKPEPSPTKPPILV